MITSILLTIYLTIATNKRSLWTNLSEYARFAGQFACNRGSCPKDDNIVESVYVHIGRRRFIGSCLRFSFNIASCSLALLTS